MDIQGKIAIITGASSGIGAATARELAQRGATVVIAARRADELHALAQEIERQGGPALAVTTDVSQLDEIERLVQTTVDTYGRVDILVNNAGVGAGGSLFDRDDAALRQVIDVNLLAPARLIKAVVPHMRRQGGGVIVNIGSVAGEVATTWLYSATKFGLRGLNDALRRQLRHDRIDVVLIAPGYIRTAMTEGLGLPMPGPEVVARTVADAIRRPRRRIVVPWFYALFAFGAKAMPWLADLVLGSSFVQRRYQRARQSTKHGKELRDG